jgi:hypothetical protein
MFNNQELKNLYILLERTQLSGKESITCAILMQKIQSLITTEPVEEKTDEPAQ